MVIAIICAGKRNGDRKNGLLPKDSTFAHSFCYIDLILIMMMGDNAPIILECARELKERRIPMIAIINCTKYQYIELLTDLA